MAIEDRRLHWSEEYKINISTIDAQHKQLFNTYTELKRALRKGLRPHVIEDILKKLEAYVTRHFIIEERYMHQTGYPGLAEQQVAHREFSAIFTDVASRFAEQGLTPDIATTLRSELGHWLLHHVTGLDMEFGKYYHSLENNES